MSEAARLKLLSGCLIVILAGLVIFLSAGYSTASEGTAGLKDLDEVIAQAVQKALSAELEEQTRLEKARAAALTSAITDIETLQALVAGQADAIKSEHKDMIANHQFAINSKDSTIARLESELSAEVEIVSRLRKDNQNQAEIIARLRSKLCKLEDAYCGEAATP